MKRALLGGAVATIIAAVALATVSGAEEEAHPPHRERQAAAIDYVSGTNYRNGQYDIVRELTVVTYVHNTHIVQGANYVKALADAQAARQRVVNRGTRVSGPCGGATNGADQFIGRESQGDPNVWNTQGSGAWGCYQIMPGTWNSSCQDLGTHGSATPAQQAACASRLPMSAWGG